MPKLKSGKYSSKSKIPEKFTLNTGHELFFKDKILYLKKRSDALYEELKRRDYNVEDYSSCYENIPKECYNDWQETVESRELLKERINERLINSKIPLRYYDKVVPLEQILIK